MVLAFQTHNGRIVRAITASQMREIDRIALEKTGPNLFQMMENAGRNLAELAMEFLGLAGIDDPDARARITVLAGTGRNGGGGICAARHLANRGLSVRLCLSEPENIDEIAEWQYRIYKQTPGTTVSPGELNQEPSDLILDALLGYNMVGAPRASAETLIGWINDRAASSACPVLSLDVPSGVDATTGATPGAVVKSTGTMTLALPKTGLLPHLTGDLWLADIGIPAQTYKDAGISFFAFPGAFRHPLIPMKVD